jgi:DNA-binding transcriptional LysR family regulator
MNLEWDRLKIFYYVAKEKSITRAAQHLCMLQPSVTRNIQQLEHQAKSKLLIRHPRGLILTKQGEILFEHVSNMMTELELANNKISGTIDQVSGDLTITTTHGYASTVLFPHLCNFSVLYPEITLHVMCDDMDLDLIKKEADVAVRPYDMNASGLEQVFLYERKLQLFTNEDYLKKNGIPEKPEDLDEHKLIVFENPNNLAPFADTAWILTLGMVSGKKRKPFITVNSAECLAQAAQKGLGIIALSHDSMLIEKCNLRRIFPTIEGPTNKMHYTYPKSIKNLPIVKLMEDYLKKSLKY